jgi:predicted nucleotidyltransferase component of viral defense system
MFIIPDKSAAMHKTWLYRVLEAIADDPALASVLYFKGGTCAAMLGWLDRFSVDLDFDYAGAKEDIPKIRMAMESIFSRLGLTIKDSSKTGIQYFLKYDNAAKVRNTPRNTLKIEATFPIPDANKYAPQRLTDIDRIFNCQTKETMFANKLVASLDRFKHNGKVAGRDIYDVHHFFMSAYDYDPAVIHGRTGKDAKAFLEELVAFIDKEVTDKVITEDLNSLLPLKEFTGIRKNLKWETKMAINEEIKRLSA